MKLDNVSIIAFCLYISATFVCCTNERIDAIYRLEEQSSERPYKQNHTIPLEQALSALDVYLAEEEGMTRSDINKRVIRDVYPVIYQADATRLGELSELNCDSLLYIVNYEDEQGFAVLAADDRIEHEIIAVTDQGNLQSETINEAIQGLNNRRIIDGYPTTGDGFFYHPDYPGEVFINPNTVSLADYFERDTLVGNFSLDDIGEMDEYGNLIPQRATPFSPPDIPSQIASALCVGYAVEEVERATFLLENHEPIIEGIVRVDTLISPWSDTQVVAPILANYYFWKQRSPFNDWYPERRKYLLFGHKRKAPAGCFPLAISKIMTHFAKPASFTYNGFTVNWNNLQSGSFASIDSVSSAALLRGISVGCDCWCFYQGTFTFPGKATSFMRLVGFTGTRSYDYSDSKVINMLDNGCPLIVYSIPGINIFHSHSWNLDGYKASERTITKKRFIDGILNCTTTITQTRLMVHCDFGWGGDCNGYYTSGVFKLNSPEAVYDNIYGNELTTEYGPYLKIVTYDNPLE